MLTYSVPAQVTAALVAATVATVALILQIVFRYLDQRGKRNQAILEKRQEALLTPLKVIDHVYGNSPFGEEDPTHPHEWDLTLAHDAMNKMIIYCKHPKKAVRAFMEAIGVHNPDTQVARKYGPKDLARFRRVVCEELELPETNYTDEDVVWIRKLPGSK